jgi:arginine/lysine/ornithine decarboxylase
MIVTGSFIEGLYISTGLVKTYPKDLLPDDAKNLILTPLIRVVLDQKRSVSELLTMLRAIEQTEPVTTIVADLKDLETQYAALNIEEQIKNNKANLVLSDKNLIEITNIVEKLRKNITD